jgi:hypothetical protein
MSLALLGLFAVHRLAFAFTRTHPQWSGHTRRQSGSGSAGWSGRTFPRLHRRRPPACTLGETARGSAGAPVARAGARTLEAIAGVCEGSGRGARSCEGRRRRAGAGSIGEAGRQRAGRSAAVKGGSGRARRDGEMARRRRQCWWARRGSGRACWVVRGEERGVECWKPKRKREQVTVRLQSKNDGSLSSRLEGRALPERAP